MDCFSEEHSRHLIGKEWLVKVDNEHSTPYLFKFYSSAIDLSCSILVTDTRTVWFEVLSSNQLARRWREVNPLRSKSFTGSEEEDEWRVSTLAALSAAHTIGNMSDLSFETVKTTYSDFAFELECGAFKWRWETNLVGPKISAEILSKQLVLPLISVTHLAFNSAESVNGMTDGDLEKAVDKAGRTARRTLDTHIRNAMSKPRLATTLRRMTAMFSFIPELPKITSSADKQELEVYQPDVVRHESRSRPHNRVKSSEIPDVQMASPRAQSPNINLPDWLEVLKPEAQGGSPSANTKAPSNASQKDDSATESSEGGYPERTGNDTDLRKGIDPKKRSTSSKSPGDADTTGPALLKAVPRKPQIISASSDDDSPPVRPTKKAKQKQITSSDDSDSEPKRRGTSAGTLSNRGGTKQPIKRGGRRF